MIHSFYVGYVICIICITCRVARSDSNLYSLMEISILTVANFVGFLSSVSQYQIGNLCFFLISTFLQSTCWKNVTHTFQIVQLKKTSLLMVFKRTWNLYFMSKHEYFVDFYLNCYLFYNIKSKAGSRDRSASSKSNIENLFSTSENQHRTQ